LVSTANYANGEHLNLTDRGYAYYEKPFDLTPPPPTLAPINHTAIAVGEAIKGVQQQPQAQSALNNQLSALRLAAKRLGLYDADDFIGKYVS